MDSALTQVCVGSGQVQKGTIQLAQALAFLHTQAKLVHLNVTPDAVLINATVGMRSRLVPACAASQTRCGARGRGGADSVRQALMRTPRATGRLEALGVAPHAAARRGGGPARDGRRAGRIRLSGRRSELAPAGAVEPGLHWCVGEGGGVRMIGMAC